MLGAKNGHKDVVFILTQKGTDLNLVNKVSLHVHVICEGRKTKFNMYLLFPKNRH